MLRRARFAVLVAAFAAPAVAAADQGGPHAAPVLRVLGPNAERVLAPSSGVVTALVTIPRGVSAAALGVEEIAPGVGMVRGRARDLLAFSAAHPGLAMEVTPPLKPLLDKAVVYTNDNRVRGAFTGEGTVVGVADTGLDVTHPDFLDDQGHSRVAWMIDMSLPQVGLHPDLEAKYGKKTDAGAYGAVFTGADLDALRAGGDPAKIPGDEVGHGTHVTGIAAGNGGLAPNPHTSYVGIASKATIVFARISGAGSESFEEGDLLNGVRFLFDRGDALGKPVVVNLSLGSEVGPHDGTASWEGVLASFVGPTHPGHALVVAAGNSGSIAEAPTHQSVFVPDGGTMRVPIVANGGVGGVQVWITGRAGASLSVGLEGPDGEWVAPVAAGSERGHNASGYTSGVINGVDSDGNGGSTGGAKLGSTPYALVLWSGTWPVGTYNVTLTGSGTAELYVSGTNEAAAPGLVAFAGGVREGTINLPATHPSILSVGCTINKPAWRSIYGDALGINVPILDGVGGLPTSDQPRDAIDGEICYFSSAGPTITGVPKPEIAAPGGIVASSMAKQAAPGTPTSVFTTRCPNPKNGGPNDPRCFQVDKTHAVQAGTSMSAPLVAGAVALLFQRDPTLTQDKIVSLVQAGAHPFRGPAPFQDQGGPGELDVQGALDALDQMQNPALVLPSRDKSWVTLGADYFAADDSTPMTAIYELRTADGAHRADLFDAARLEARVVAADVVLTPPLTRLAPGLWTATFRLPRGMGGTKLTVGATFDGVAVVEPKSVPIATDIWNGEYPAHVKGGCAAGGAAGGNGLESFGSVAIVSLLTIAAIGAARRRRGPAVTPTTELAGATRAAPRPRRRDRTAARRRRRSRRRRAPSPSCRAPSRSPPPRSRDRIPSPG